MKMEGKIALVTGAAPGYKAGGPSIGSAIAFKLASEGAKVVVVDVVEKMGQRTADDFAPRIRANAICPSFVQQEACHVKYV